jgi:hypothetical protein
MVNKILIWGILIIGFPLFSIELDKSSSQSDSLNATAFGITYYNNFDSKSRVEFNFLELENEFYETQFTPIYLSWINKDKYNHDDLNFSVSPLLELSAALLILSPFSNQTSGRIFDYFINSFNYTHYFHLFSSYKYSDLPQYTDKSFSLFIQNRTDIFVFQKHNWAEATPGVGIRYQNHGVALNIGFEGRLRVIDKHKPDYLTGIFCSLSLVMPSRSW